MATLAFSLPITAEEDRRALAAGLRRRDPEVLEALISQYQYRLFRYLLYLTGARETAEDVFQETWIRVLDRGHLYDGRARFETWLFAIARHLVIDLQRKRRPEPLADLADPAVDALSPLELCAARERSANVQAAMDRLPAVFREVLLLRFQEDLGLEEIAAITGAPLSTVKSRLYRGLDALRQALEGDGV
jgi:RNA polymerase sigma-70 factor, ECF subfamily